MRRLLLALILGLASNVSEAGELYYRIPGDPNSRNIYAVDENGGTPRLILDATEYPLGSIAGMTRFNHAGSNGQALLQSKPYSAPAADIQLVYRALNGTVITLPVTALEGVGLNPYGPPFLAQDDSFFSFVARDSNAGRSTIWGLASTTLGAVMHETGHAFGLPHTTDPLDIMTRGFDRLNRVFSLVEPPSKSHGEPREFTLEEAAEFAPVSAACLKTSRWFALDEFAVSDGNPPTVEFDDEGGALIRSDTGLRYVALLRGGNAVGFRSFWDKAAPAPRETKLSEADLAPKDGRIDEVRAVDYLGATTTERVVLPARFVRAWRFAKNTKPWSDPSRFVELDAKDLDHLAADARARDLVVSTSAYVDFLTRFDRSQNVAAYATRTVVVPAPTKVRLKTGSDDALRVWVGGKLVQQKLVMRGAHPDEESAEIALAAGLNVMLVEVSQGGGGWGLYLRFEDLKGAPLHLTDGGDLAPTR